MFAFEPDAPNVVPGRYRQVALSTDLESLDPDWLARHFTGREAYMRTRYIVARAGERTALLETDRGPSPDLFSRIEHVRMLAGESECRYVVDDQVDCGVPSDLAAVAMRHRDVRCVVVEGRYSHVSFILNPKPLVLRVLDIVPPFPSKLLDQVQRVLSCAEDLPPIVVEPIMVDSREVLAEADDRTASHILVPCRGSGIDLPGVEVSYLDERPPAADWTLLGCERSHQIHRWFYGKAPRAVDICPIRFVQNQPESGGPMLTRCCLIQEGVEDRKRATFVPWGSSLDEVRRAIEGIVERAEVAWTAT